MPDLETELSEFWDDLIGQSRPVDVDALIARTPQVAAEDDVVITEVPEVHARLGPLGDDLAVDVVWELDERTPPEGPRTLFAVAAAVAAAILLVVGVAVISDGGSEGVVTDPASVPGATDPPVTSPDADDPVAVPSVTAPAVAAEDVFAGFDEDTPGCEIPQGWAQVCDAQSFDGAAMYAVTAGGPGLVAVGGDNKYYTREGYTPDWDGWIRVSDAVVLTSPDGLTWTRVPHEEAVFGGDGSQHMFGVTVGGPGLVAVGRDGPAVDGEGMPPCGRLPTGLPGRGSLTTRPFSAGRVNSGWSV